MKNAVTRDVIFILFPVFVFLCVALVPVIEIVVVIERRAGRVHGHAVGWARAFEEIDRVPVGVRVAKEACPYGHPDAS